MQPSIDITPAEAAIIADILARELPQGAQVWVFGSRAKGRAGFNSDLDLAIQAAPLQPSPPLPAIVLHTLREALSIAPLPYRVDVVDMAQIAPDFAAKITAHRLPFALLREVTR
jgi:uncharacterized protein